MDKTNDEKQFSIYWDLQKFPGEGAFMTLADLREWSLKVWNMSRHVLRSSGGAKGGLAKGESKRRLETQAKSIAAMTAARIKKAEERRKLK